MERAIQTSIQFCFQTFW